MSMSSLFRPLLLLFCFLGAFNSFAASGGFYLINNSTYYDSDAYYVCKQLSFESIVYQGITYTYTEQSKSYTGASSSGSGFTCSVRYFNDTGGHRIQSGVLNGSPVYMTSYSCASSIGDTKILSWPMGRDLPPDGYQDFGTIYPATACFSGCNSTYDGSGSEPYTVPGSEGSDIVYIDATYTLDGSACAASSAEPGAPSIPPAPESDPCVTDPASCDPDPGGGDTGGGDTGGGDTGGGDTGGGDTGGGDTGGDDTTVDPTPGDGTQPGEPGTGTGESVASGMACDQPTICQGDAIQCAILSQQKAHRCFDVESENYVAQEGAIKSLVDGPEFELEQSQVSAPSLLDQHGRFLPSASCPPPESFSLNSNGGHSFQFSYEPICTMATDLSWLIVAFATLSAALYIGRSFGGG